ncbi:MAG: beta-ketoacyl synthase N-terminal-like domain-containing protein [Planctomycetota bacterium]
MSRHEPERVVVTGAGSLGWYGVGQDALAIALAAGSPSFPEIERRTGVHPRKPARHAGLVDGSAIGEWVSPREGRRMGPASRFTLAAARMALQQAGTSAEAIGGPGFGIALSTAFGSTRMTEDLVLEILDDPESTSPFLFTECVANAPAGQIAIRLNAQGANTTLTQREAGPLLSVIHAARDIAAGRLDRAIVGAVEEMPPLTHAILDRFSALAHQGLDGRELPRPFDRDRDGIVASEGATCLLLERESAARARGAEILAVIAGWARAFDPTAPAHTWGAEPGPLADCLVEGLSRFGIVPEDISLIVSGASGARRGDALEAGVLRASFGDRLPPIVTPKAVTGEFAGGLLGPGVLAITGATFAMPAGFQREDPALGLRPTAIDGPASRALLTGLASGGVSTWLVLESAR